MPPRFNSLVLDPVRNELTVDGVFETNGTVIASTEVTIRFLLIPDHVSAALTAPMVGTAAIAPAALTRTGTAPALLTQGPFQQVVPNAYGLNPGDDVRGIGQSIALKEGASGDPPAFDNFTWCVNLKVT